MYKCHFLCSVSACVLLYQGCQTLITCTVTVMRSRWSWAVINSPLKKSFTLSGAGIKRLCSASWSLWVHLSVSPLSYAYCCNLKCYLPISFHHMLNMPSFEYFTEQCRTSMIISILTVVLITLDKICIAIYIFTNSPIDIIVLNLFQTHKLKVTNKGAQHAN